MHEQACGPGHGGQQPLPELWDRGERAELDGQQGIFKTTIRGDQDI